MTLVLEGAMISGATIFGKALIMKAITDTYEHLYDHDDQNYADVLAKLDIKADLEVIENMLYEFSNSDSCPIVELCIKHVHEEIENIQDTMKKINTKIIEHKEKYFFYWRHPDYDTEISTLKEQKILLDHRIDKLFTVIRLSK